MSSNVINNDLIAKLVELGFNEFVFTDVHLKNDVLGNKSIRVYIDADARSGAFYAYSLAKQNRKVSLFVSEEQLTDAYTAIMESYMQSIGFVIIAYNSTGYRSTLFLRRCTNSIEELNSQEDIIQFLFDANINRPLVIKVNQKVVEPKFDYSIIIENVRKVNSEVSLFAYNAKNETVINIEQQYASCVLTKYVGYLTGSKGKSILMIPERLLLLDLNIFSIRNFPQSFKLIVKTENEVISSKCKDWIESNRVSVRIAKDKLPDAIIELLSISSPQVLFV